VYDDRTNLERQWVNNVYRWYQFGDGRHSRPDPWEIVQPNNVVDLFALSKNNPICIEIPLSVGPPYSEHSSDPPTIGPAP